MQFPQKTQTLFPENLETFLKFKSVINQMRLHWPTALYVKEKPEQMSNLMQQKLEEGEKR